MSSQQLPLGEWVKQVNDAIFYQPKDEVALKALNEDVDSSLVVKLNHSVFTYEEMKGGVLYIRGSGGMTLNSVSEVLKWDDTEKQGGVVAHLTTFTTKNNENGQEAKKTSLITSTVKWIDGRRKLTELVEVEIEE
ncbi:uncharacterized protein NECHADRAFT_80780 [Fusarium vanettenii 77-13-4]|uniref:Uncharacterized protein n=1 Tax=Fusarium vanettenii (strain ATCC MYA-4622 / CBS 123669 / FGSC 9596 / NRRL 45880 / 77-13-4) TaxID=660122 RepID=C7YSL8_FUSV7|nr:uncharacterized protein NECHADRAFT_80780 [Fusarium vanettenii 77-13-4]EEU45664.1 predicted protein [Fusarium vanettenii 77-13-4]